MSKIKKWLVVANASNAKVFFIDYETRTLQSVKEFNHPDSRKKVHELVSDKTGYYGVAGFAKETYT